MSLSVKNTRIKEALAQWQLWGIDERPEPTKILSGGKTNKSILLKSGNEQLVLKIYRQPDNRAQQSHRAQQAVCALGLAPDLIYASATNYYSVSSYVNGSTLTSHIPIDQNKLTALCTSIKKYQQVGVPDNVINYPALLQTYRHHLLEQSLWNNSLEQQYKPAITHCNRLEEHFRDCALVLSHHDLIPENIIDSNDQFCFIDWEFSCGSYPCFDYAILLVELNINENALIKASGFNTAVLMAAASVYRYLCKLYWISENKKNSADTTV